MKLLHIPVLLHACHAGNWFYWYEEDSPHCRLNACLLYPTHAQAIRDAITRRADVTVTLLNYTKGGVPFWNELRLTPVTDPGSGRLLAYIGVQNDVTELVGYGPGAHGALVNTLARVRA